jgi:hypothetical protein
MCDASVLKLKSCSYSIKLCFQGSDLVNDLTFTSELHQFHNCTRSCEENLVSIL